MPPTNYSTCPINELTKIIVDEMYQTYFMYGPGLFERIYEATLEGRLRAKGLQVERQRQVRITNEYVQDEPAFYADLIVENRVVLELKSVDKISRKMFKQVRSYMKLTNISVGYLVNFDCALLKNNMHRIVVNYDKSVHGF